MIASRLGEPGFAHYLHELRAMGVLTRSDVRAWLALHGAVVCILEPPLNDGDRLDEDGLAQLEQELGQP